MWWLLAGVLLIVLLEVARCLVGLIFLGGSWYLSYKEAFLIIVWEWKNRNWKNGRAKQKALHKYIDKTKR
jgi:hypothetical protein